LAPSDGGLVFRSSSLRWLPPAPAVRAALRAPRGELLRLPGGHYAVYEGRGFERAVEAELAFLERHLSALDEQPAALQAAHTPRRAEVGA